MSLGKLTGLSSDQKQEHKANAENQNIKGGGKYKNDGTDPDRNNYNDMAKLFDHLIQNLEYQVEQDLRQQGSNYKAKKKREKWQRR
jgi:hypothetical protein